MFPSFDNVASLTTIFASLDNVITYFVGVVDCIFIHKLDQNIESTSWARYAITGQDYLPNKSERIQNQTRDSVFGRTRLNL